jgi:hypothetical protein
MSPNATVIAGSAFVNEGHFNILAGVVNICVQSFRSYGLLSTSNRTKLVLDSPASFPVGEPEQWAKWNLESTDDMNFEQSSVSRSTSSASWDIAGSVWKNNGMLLVKAGVLR